MYTIVSRPVWGAWIEIMGQDRRQKQAGGSRPVWGAWIEMESRRDQTAKPRRSRPVWGAWIEILMISNKRSKQEVAPRMGRVD